MAASEFGLGRGSNEDGGVLRGNWWRVLTIHCSDDWIWWEMADAMWGSSLLAHVHEHRSQEIWTTWYNSLTSLLILPSSASQKSPYCVCGTNLITICMGSWHKPYHSMVNNPQSTTPHHLTLFQSRSWTLLDTSTIIVLPHSHPTSCHPKNQVVHLHLLFYSQNPPPILAKFPTWHWGICVCSSVRCYIRGVRIRCYEHQDWNGKELLVSQGE
jgi:hypothetical protein